MKQIEYQAQIDDRERHVINTELLIYDCYIYYIVVIDNVENNLNEAYEGETPVSKFLVKIWAFNGDPLQTSFEIISQEGVYHKNIYSPLP